MNCSNCSTVAQLALIDVGGRVCRTCQTSQTSRTSQTGRTSRKRECEGERDSRLGIGVRANIIFLGWGFRPQCGGCIFASCLSRDALR